MTDPTHTGPTTDAPSCRPPERARERLRADLRRGRLDRDDVALSALQTALAAIDNAEVVPYRRQEAVEGKVPDVPRRDLDAAGVAAALDAEIAEADAARAEREHVAPDTPAVADLHRTVALLTRHRDLARASD